MQLQITGKHLDLGEALQQHCQRAIERISQKYHLDPTHCNIWFSKKEHHQFGCELSLHLGRSVYIRTHAETHDSYTAFDKALLRADDKIAKHKQRLDDHHKHHDNHHYQKLSAIDSILGDQWAKTEAGSHLPIVSESLTDVPSLTVDSAAMHLELSDHPVLVFYNKKHGRLNVLYRRTDQSLGWIDLRDSAPR